jgi:SAM-dependent methyltransferase
VGFRDGHYLRECRCIGRVLLSWHWDDEAHYERLYTTPGLYHNDCQRVEGQSPSTLRDTEHQQAAHSRLRQLELFQPHGALLDIGTGTGAFVAAACSHHYDAHGLEPDGEIVRWAQSKGRAVWLGGWPDAIPAWDIITLHDVWEHLTQPLACLSHLKSCLQPGGLLVIEFPEWHCPQARRDGLQWRHVRPLQHIWLPDDVAARALFDRAGLTLEACIRPLRGELGKACYYLRLGE